MSIRYRHTQVGWLIFAAGVPAKVWLRREE